MQRLSPTFLRMPLRRRSAGVCAAPQHTNTASAAIVCRCPSAPATATTPAAEERDAEVAFGSPEVAVHALGAEVIQQRFATPPVVAVGRQPVPEAAVDLGRAADAAAFDVGDVLIAEDRGHAAVAVQAFD